MDKPQDQVHGEAIAAALLVEFAAELAAASWSYDAWADLSETITGPTVHLSPGNRSKTLLHRSAHSTDIQIVVTFMVPARINQQPTEIAQWLVYWDNVVDWITSNRIGGQIPAECELGSRYLAEYYHTSKTIIAQALLTYTFIG